ncbi:hypothetical protein CYMTET_4918 [Cymbomonas tetramitiformis]|uniref:3'-5' exonuclease n=1 Tax=Cymbomonas tetramitiformis TaxID=36881 RepID=A0AAE0LJK5_9CHLO|nr:hypothetical protein CYMTET_4918 [Cymbomonas tetramitiformis]
MNSVQDYLLAQNDLVHVPLSLLSGEMTWGRIRHAISKPSSLLWQWSRTLCTDSFPGSQLITPDHTVLYKASEIDEAVHEFFRRDAPSGPQVLGLDIEARPSYTKVRNPTALIQISSESRCLVAHVRWLRALPRQLRLLLEDQNVWMVGAGVKSDLNDLIKDRLIGERPAPFIDTVLVSQVFGYKRGGLKNMAAEFGVDVEKPKSIQMSNWALTPLSPRQAEYAAQDAYLGLWVLQKLHERHSDPRDHDVNDWGNCFLNHTKINAMLSEFEGEQGLAWPTCVRRALQARAEERMELIKYKDSSSQEKKKSKLLRHLTDVKRHPVAALHEVAQKLYEPVEWELRTPATSGDEIVYVLTVLLAGERIGSASGRSKTEAKAEAAQAALRYLHGGGLEALLAAREEESRRPDPPARTAVIGDGGRGDIRMFVDAGMVTVARGHDRQFPMAPGSWPDSVGLQRGLGLRVAAPTPPTETNPVQALHEAAQSLHQLLEWKVVEVDQEEVQQACQRGHPLEGVTRFQALPVLAAPRAVEEL